MGYPQGGRKFIVLCQVFDLRWENLSLPHDKMSIAASWELLLQLSSGIVVHIREFRYQPWFQSMPCS